MKLLILFSALMIAGCDFYYKSTTTSGGDFVSSISGNDSSDNSDNSDNSNNSDNRTTDIAGDSNVTGDEQNLPSG